MPSSELLTIKKIEPLIVSNSAHSEHQVLVRVETSEGLDGWGECCTGCEYGEAALATKDLIERGFSPRIVGEDPLNYRKIWDKLYSATEWYGRRGLAIFAISGIDTALVDIAGKTLGVPACKILGGCFRNEASLYVSLFFDMDNPEKTAKSALQYLEHGYTGAKLGWGYSRSNSFGMNPVRDEEAVEITRDIFGPSNQLMIDVGRYVNWTVSHAIEMTGRLEKYKLSWIEEPLPPDDLEGLARLTATSKIPIAVGENYQTLYEFQDILSRNAGDVMQPDASKAGGISESKRIVDAISSRNKMWVAHNWSTAINVAAALHLVASSPSGSLMEFKEDGNPLVNELTKEKFEIKDGKMVLNMKPGLGIEIDENILEKYRVED